MGQGRHRKENRSNLQRCLQWEERQYVWPNHEKKKTSAISLSAHFQTKPKKTYIFDVGARVNRDDIAVLNTEVMSHDTVDANAAVIEVVVRQHDKNGVFAHLTLNQDRVTAEELKSIHSVVGESNNGVIIVDGIGDAVRAGF